MTTFLNIITVVLLFSLTLVAIRLFRGPTLADRAVAGDQISIHVIALIGVYTIMTEQPMLLDLLVVTAVVGFATITVIGVFIERSARGKARRRSEAGEQSR